jgi:hypothetical protein
VALSPHALIIIRRPLPLWNSAAHRSSVANRWGGILLEACPPTVSPSDILLARLSCMGCTSSSPSQKTQRSSRQSKAHSWKNNSPVPAPVSSTINYDDESQLIDIAPPITLNREDYGEFTFVQCGGGEFHSDLPPSSVLTSSQLGRSISHQENLMGNYLQ